MNRSVVVVGGGRVGRHAAEQLSDNQYAVTVVELDPEKCRVLERQMSRVIEGDGADPDVLRRATPEDADVVAALTNETVVNLTVCELAAELAPEARTILRIAHDGEQAHGHRRFVDDVVYPAAAGAEAAVDRITRVPTPG